MKQHFKMVTGKIYCSLSCKKRAAYFH